MGRNSRQRKEKALVRAATLDTSRISMDGLFIGKRLAGLANRAAASQPDRRCRTCALREGTVANGCLQTQADIVKCFVEQREFNCHHAKNKPCGGFALIKQYRKPGAYGAVCPWEFSPDD